MQLFLNGGGSGKKTQEALQIMNQMISHDKPILYIPFAMEKSRYESCWKWVQEELKEVKSAGIEMVCSVTELLGRDLNQYGVLFFGGGNTFQLLKVLQQGNMVSLISQYLKNGGTIFGGSAGAIIFGKDIAIAGFADANDVKIVQTAGLNCLEGSSITAHYGNKDAQRNQMATQYYEQYSLEKEPILALPEEVTVFVNDDEIRWIGTESSFLFKRGKRYEIKANTRMSLQQFSQMLRENSSDNKIKSKQELISFVKTEKEQGKKIAFTNGCFDMFHVGHARYLKEASKYGDILIVGVNSDNSVKRIKGYDRPIIPEQDRAEILASMACVSNVVVFEEDTPYDLIKEIQPDFLIKGGDYRPEEVVGKDIVEQYGGKVVICGLQEGKSTTNIIKRIQKIE